MGSRFLKIGSTSLIACVALLGMFMQVGDNTLPTPAQGTHDTVANVAELQAYLAQRQQALDGVLASLEEMKATRQIDSDKLSDLVDLVSDWDAEGNSRFVCIEENVKSLGSFKTDLEERVEALEAQVRELQQQCSQCTAAVSKAAAPVAAAAPAPIYQGPVYQSVGSTVSYGSTGTSMRAPVVSYSYPTVGSTVSYGSTGTSVSYGSQGTSAAVSYQTAWSQPAPVVTETVATTTTQGQCYVDPATGQMVCPTGSGTTTTSRGLLGRIFRRR